MRWNDAPSYRAPPTFRLLRLRSQTAHQRRGAKDRGEYRMTWFALENRFRTNSLRPRAAVPNTRNGLDTLALLQKD